MSRLIGLRGSSYCSPDTYFLVIVFTNLCNARHGNLQCNCWLTYEFVAGTVHRQNESRFFWFGFDLLPQVNDVSVNCSSGWETVVSPDLFEKAITAQRLSLMANEIFQQLEFLGRKFNRLARSRNLATTQIHLYIAKRKPFLIFRNRARPAQHSFNAG